MNLDQIETKCFILALFIRDDDERFLLGSRAYEFKDSQLHFVGNMYQNDVVEVQGNDGIMLAGQVRRSNTQAFDGYIGDSSVDRSTIEQYRRDFMQFFRKNHYYKVVYIFTDGTAIQRRNGFIVEAPEVKELYQLFPEYHIGMNFEDINYYTYEEDAEGQEIYGESATLKIASSATGGLIWDSGVNTTISGEGSNFTLDGTIDGGEISNVQLNGDTTQQTYSGKNLFNGQVEQGTFDSSGQKTASTTKYRNVNPISVSASTQYTFSANGITAWDLFMYDSNQSYIGYGYSGNGTYTFGANVAYVNFAINAVNGSAPTNIQLELGGSKTSFEQYVGGIPAPNPDYPQTVNTVTGRQVVTISDGDSQSQSYEVNLGGEEFRKSAVTSDYYLTSAGALITDPGWCLTDYMSVDAGRDYIYDGITLAGNAPYSAFYDKNKVLISTFKQATGSNTITAPNNAVFVRFSLRDESPNVDKDTFTFKLDGIDIELCKIGTYQDYIYKSSGNWYVHKMTDKVLLGNLEWYSATTAQSGVYRMQTPNLNTLYAPPTTSTELASIFCTHYVPQTQGGTWNCNTGFGFNMASPGVNSFVYDPSYNTTTSASSFKTWLTNNNVTLYYALATATDTKITNTALIAQLNALAGATTYNGSTSFTVDGNGNLAAILAVEVEAVGGGGVEWDNYGAEWEEGTGGGPTMVNVDSIDNVYPVWTLTGPAVNPQISVLTTNTTLSYTGTVTASQTLKIDMFNKTATLNGASVIGNVSGDWVYLKPGTNRITYTTGNADAPDSTIWWQEIMG